MRKSPDPKAKIVTKIKNGSTVEVKEHSDGWYFISYNGQEGYVQEQYLKLLSDAIGKEIYSNGATLYLRENMDTSSRVVGMVNAQQAMTVEQITDDWALVSSGSVKGYIQINDINQLNEEPAAVAAQKWTAGVLQKETKLYRDPDKNSEVISTWPKGQGVAISPYNKEWSLVQIQDENIVGFARKASVSISPIPTVEPEKQVIDESQFISASKAKSIAENALKKFSGFSAKSLTCRQDTALSTDGIQGPMFRFNYTNKQGQHVFTAYIHAYSGKVLYIGDYTEFVRSNTQALSEFKTAAPKTTQEPDWWYDDDGNVVWAEETPVPMEGTDIGQSAARSIADRYLSARYGKFSQMEFTRVSCRHVTDPAGASFQVPYYQFDYYIANDLTGEDLEYEIMINAYTEEIEYCSSGSLGEGNG